MVKSKGSRARKAPRCPQCNRTRRRREKRHPSGQAKRRAEWSPGVKPCQFCQED